MTKTMIMRQTAPMMRLSFMFFHHMAFLSFTVDFLNWLAWFWRSSRGQIKGAEGEVQRPGLIVKQTGTVEAAGEQVKGWWIPSMFFQGERWLQFDRKLTKSFLETNGVRISMQSVAGETPFGGARPQAGRGSGARWRWSGGEEGDGISPVFSCKFSILSPRSMTFSIFCCMIPLT